jgi:hypothetical protein
MSQFKGFGMQSSAYVQSKDCQGLLKYATA